MGAEYSVPVDAILHFWILPLKSVLHEKLSTPNATKYFWWKYVVSSY